jgi:hypothetical protein
MDSCDPPTKINCEYLNASHVFEDKLLTEKDIITDTTARKSKEATALAVPPPPIFPKVNRISVNR